MSKSPTNHQGFSVIESAMAMIILTVGLFAVVQFFPLSLKIVGNSQQTTTATNLALKQIEAISQLNYDNITPGTLEAKQRLASDPGSYLYSYQRQTVVETVDADFNPCTTDIGFKKIVVTVYWLSPIGAVEKSIALNLVRTNY